MRPSLDWQHLDTANLDSKIYELAAHSHPKKGEQEQVQFRNGSKVKLIC